MFAIHLFAFVFRFAFMQLDELRGNIDYYERNNVLRLKKILKKLDIMTIDVFKADFLGLPIQDRVNYLIRAALANFENKSQ